MYRSISAFGHIGCKLNLRHPSPQLFETEHRHTPMIIIEITNVKELVRDRRGWFSANVGPYFTDLEARVEQEVIDEILAVFEARGVKANIASVGGVNMRSIHLAGEGRVQHTVVVEVEQAGELGEEEDGAEQGI